MVIVGPSTSNILPVLDIIGGIEIAWHWLALVGWVGLLTLQAFLFTQKKQMPALLASLNTRTYRFEAVSLDVLLVGEVGILVLRAMDLSYFQRGRDVDLLALRQVLVDTTYGQLWLLRLACVLAGPWARSGGSPADRVKRRIPVWVGEEGANLPESIRLQAKERSSIAVQIDQQVQGDHRSDKDHDDPRRDFNLAKMRFEPLQECTDLVEAETEEEERDAHPKRVEEQE